MSELNLTYVDELISVRQVLHGGNRGAPRRVEDGSREGESINRSCIIMMSALLQSYIQEIFKICAKMALPSLEEASVWDAYWKQMKGWGNPSADNTKALFLKIGVSDIFDSLSWQKCNNAAVRRNLNELNHIRNSIAHGAAQLRVNNLDYSLTLAKVKKFRNFTNVFSNKFEGHALRKFQRPNA